VISMPNKHQKHTKLAKPLGGRFHRNEWTVIGAPCTELSEFVTQISKRLHTAGFKSSYLDMSHNAENLEEGPSLKMVDKLNHWVLQNSDKLHEQEYRKYFNSSDLLFVNGNHYQGHRQIVFINSKKKDSLQRKIDRLTDVAMIVFSEGEKDIFPFLKDQLNSDTKSFRSENLDAICNYIQTKLTDNVSPLNGLILNGGKSSRMGTSKGQLDYHGKEQKEFEADLLSNYCSETYYSISKSTDKSSSEKYPIIKDTFIGLGPYGGILSAFRHNPNAAWLSLACDLPFLDKASILQLVEARNPSKLATCFYNPETDFPEPLITIWEPRAYPVLLDFLSQGYSCPRKVLINSDIEMIIMDDPIKLKNANTPEEKVHAENYLNSSS